MTSPLGPTTNRRVVAIVTSRVHATISTMSLLLVTHPSGFQHVGPTEHPERPDRLEAVVSGVLAAEGGAARIEARTVDRTLIERVHTRAYIDDIERFCARGGGALDEDTYAVEASYEAAMFAAGAGPTAVTSLVDGDYEAAFVAVRPPGHHAEADGAMGFCLFNNVAVTATYLASRGSSVAVIDWDVHHGNGTQRTFYADPDVLYVSLHQSPFYPGSGAFTEVGTAQGLGTTVNIPLQAGTSSAEYLEAFARIVVPVVRQFEPDWILVSCGYDAHKADPIGGLMLESNDYQRLASTVSNLVPSGRVIVMLEGGYDLSALSESSLGTVEGLMGGTLAEALPRTTADASARVLDKVVDALTPYWELR